MKAHELEALDCLLNTFIDIEQNIYRFEENALQKGIKGFILYSDYELNPSILHFKDYDDKFKFLNYFGEVIHSHNFNPKMLRNEFFHHSKRNSDIQYHYRVKFFSDDVFNIKFESGEHSFEISLNDYSSLLQIPKEIRDNFKENKFLTCYIKLTGKGNFRCQAESDSLIFNSQYYLQKLLDGSISNLIDSRKSYEYYNPKKHIDININLCDPKITPFSNAEKANLYHIAGLRLLWATTHWTHCNIKSGFLPIDKTPDEHLLLFVKNKLKEFNDKMYLFYEELHNSQEMIAPDLSNTKPVVYRLKQIFK